MISAQQLKELLTVMREAGVTQATINEAGLAVVFGPEPAPRGADPTPGAWKGGPSSLDQDLEAFGDE